MSAGVALGGGEASGPESVAKYAKERSERKGCRHKKLLNRPKTRMELSVTWVFVRSKMA